MREGTPRSPEWLYRGYVFDLDGTIYLGDELLPGASSSSCASSTGASSPSPTTRSIDHLIQADFGWRDD